MELEQMIAEAQIRGEFNYADILAEFDDGPVYECYEDEDESI